MGADNDELPDSLPDAPPARPLRVASIGTGFMGRAHSHAWRTAASFFDMPLRPELSLIVGRSTDSTRERAAQFGWKDWSTDWRDAITRDDIDVIDVCVPGRHHAEIVLAALAAGKHVLCEKPLANSVAEAEQMTLAAEDAVTRGVFSMCGFSYRRTPALALAKHLIDEGRVGAIRHIRANYLQDWLSDSSAPLTWRMKRAEAGSGALGDIGAHSIDTAQWLTGQRITRVSALLRTFVSERPIPTDLVGLSGVAEAHAELGAVDVDDAAAFLADFTGGALGVFEATRMATGRRNANRIEINGERGSIAFDFERMNELEFYDATRGGDLRGFERIQATEATHPYMAAWWPAGHGIGYEHVFTHQVVDLIDAIASGVAPSPSFADALGVQRILAAIEVSAANHSVSTPVPGASA